MSSVCEPAPSELLRRGAEAILEAEHLALADEVFRQAYRRQPQDPVVVRAVARLAAEGSVPEW